MLATRGAENGVPFSLTKPRACRAAEICRRLSFSPASAVAASTMREKMVGPGPIPKAASPRPQLQPISVKELAFKLPRGAWRTIKLREASAEILSSRHPVPSRLFKERAAHPIRPERHIPSSLATMRRRVIVALTRRLSLSVLHPAHQTETTPCFVTH